ncbi:MAG TPA: phage tail protein [Rhizobium sp.]|nr:phage tail protein [Rhizobium sp.]
MQVTIPSAIVRVEQEDVTLELICFWHLMKVLKDRDSAARVTGYVEATAIANAHLVPTILLPFGATVILPEFEVVSSGPQTRRLWD